MVASIGLRCSKSPRGLEGAATGFHIFPVLFVEGGLEIKLRRRGDGGPANRASAAGLRRFGVGLCNACDFKF